MAMDTLDAGTGHTPHTQARDTEEERKDRFTWEAEGVAEARAQLDAGLYVEADEMRTWIDSLRTSVPLPLPPTRRR